MLCPICRTLNDNENTFCVNCGSTIVASSGLATLTLPNAQIPIPTGGDGRFYPSTPTHFVQHPNVNSSDPGFQQRRPVIDPTIPQSANQVENKRSKTWLFVTLGILGIFILAGVGIGAFFFLKPSVQTGERLPEHLGMFSQNKEKNQLTELRKIDSQNVLDAKDKLFGDDTLPVIGEKPELILYADGMEVPIADLKLIQLDSVKADGTMKYIDFQPSLVDGKPAMKRIKFGESLAIGKYAFVRFDGYFDEGKHKFWAFEIKNAEKRDNGTLARETVVAIKPKPATNDVAQKATIVSLPPAPKPEVIVPSGARVGYCNNSDVRLRSGPGLKTAVIGKLGRRQRVFVMQYSSNTDYWKGTQANWAYVQTEAGKSGWVFSPFISY